jgi:hypothetical protein
MVAASDKLVIAGPPDLSMKDEQDLVFTNEAETRAAFKGEKGACVPARNTLIDAMKCVI